MRRKLFCLTIKELLQIGSIIAYIQENWQAKSIKVDIWENSYRLPDRYIVNEIDIRELQLYLLDNWYKQKIKIVVWEMEKELEIIRT